MMTAPSWGTRLLGMEGLRGLAAVTVLMGHVSVHLAAEVNFGPTGRVLGLLSNGLTLFFALSGFLLFRPFASSLLGARAFPSVRRFLTNRMLRIFPAYLVVFALVAFVLGAAFTTSFTPGQGLDETGTSVGYLTDPLVILPNLFMAQTFFPFSMKTGLGVAWTLSVELIFYLVLPLLALLACKLRRPGIRAALLPVAVVFLVGVAGKIVFAATFHPATAAEAFSQQWGGTWYAVFARSFLVHADLFAFGMLAALLLAAFECGRLHHRFIEPVRWAGLGLGLVAVLTAMAGSRFLPVGPFADSAWAFAFGTLILFVALPAGTGSPGRAARALDAPPLRFVGLISYSLYLWHVPVIWSLDRVGWVSPASYWGYWANVAIVLVVSGLLATLTYYLVELPPLRLKKRPEAAGPSGVAGERMPAVTTA